MLYSKGESEAKTYGASRSKLSWTLHHNLVDELVNMLAAANAELATEQLLLELRNLWSDVAELIVPLVHSAFAHVPSEITALAIVKLVVDWNGIRPASLLGLSLELFDVECRAGRRGISSNGCVAIIAVGVVAVHLTEGRLGRSVSRSAPRVSHVDMEGAVLLDCERE